MSTSVPPSLHVPFGLLPFRSLAWLESPFASHLERSSPAFPSLVPVLLLLAETREGILACNLTGFRGHPSCIWGQDAQFSGPLACELYFHRVTTQQSDNSMFLLMRPSASHNSAYVATVGIFQSNAGHQSCIWSCALASASESIAVDGVKVYTLLRCSVWCAQACALDYIVLSGVVKHYIYCTLLTSFA